MICFNYKLLIGSSVFFFIVMGCNTKHVEINIDDAEKIIKRIDIGTINVGQNVCIEIPVENSTDQIQKIHHVGVCCGNPKPQTDKDVIPPQDAVLLTQCFDRKKEGPFQITTKAYLYSKHPTVSIFNISGTAYQPLEVLLGWDSKELHEASYNKVNNLQTIYQNGPCLIALISHKANDRLLHHKDNLEISSRYFRTAEYELEESRQRALVENYNSKNDYRFPGNGSQSYISVILEPTSIFPIGEIEDEITITLTDETKCIIPLSFRAVGKIYSEDNSIALGEIKDEKFVKNVKLFFEPGLIDELSDIDWDVNGTLAEAIKIYPSKLLNSRVAEYEVVIDGRLLSRYNSKYISAIITFYSNKSLDDKTKILVYGYI